MSEKVCLANWRLDYWDHEERKWIKGAVKWATKSEALGVAQHMFNVTPGLKKVRVRYRGVLVMTLKLEYVQ